MKTNTKANTSYMRKKTKVGKDKIESVTKKSEKLTKSEQRKSKLSKITNIVRIVEMKALSLRNDERIHRYRCLNTSSSSCSARALIIIIIYITIDRDQYANWNQIERARTWSVKVEWQLWECIEINWKKVNGNCDSSLSNQSMTKRMNNIIRNGNK